MYQNEHAKPNIIRTFENIKIPSVQYSVPIETKIDYCSSEKII